MYPVNLHHPCTLIWYHVKHTFTIITPTEDVVTLVCPGHG